MKERDEPIEFDDKSFNQNSGGAGGAGAGAGSAAADNKAGFKQEFANPIAILKLRLQKIIATNKEKKHLLDKYMRNAKIIEDAFEQIREQSGSATMNIEEIVTAFIKAEEQNRSLQTYVNLLNQETDVLEERNRQLDSSINTF